MPGGYNPPVDVSASWPAPNYVNPELRPNTIFVLSCILGPLTLIFCFARLWVRIFHQKNAGVDDWLMLAAMPFTIVLTVLYPLADQGLFNRHLWDVDLFTNTQIVVVARKYVMATEAIFCIATGLVKVSILLFYRRLSDRVVSKGFFWTTWITIGYIVGYSVALSIAPIVGCQPISAAWDQFDPIKRLTGYKYHCFNEGADVLAASILSASQDLLTAVLPTFLYWNLKIPFRQKVALFGIFAMGYGVVSLGVLRAYYSWYTFYATYDITWSSWDLLLTSLLELHIGCLCANAPALKVLFKHFFQETLTTKSRTKTPSGSNNRSGISHTFSAQSKMSMWSKVSSIFSKESKSPTRSTRGYHDSHAGVSIDPHGGVYVEREIDLRRSPTSMPDSLGDRRVSAISTINSVDRYYDDIELGLFTTRNSPTSIVHVQHDLDSSARAAFPPRSSSLPSQARVAEPLAAHPVLPPTRESSESIQALPPIAPRAPTPLPSLSLGQYRPRWQSWS